ncbi:MAG: NAD(P)H-binding protein [Propionibacteriaceae bacterium]|jgi:putative NADH-flavin reductase|nr:NAD(P)H-binding protein [Propionibacteriaceae bacterium]
MTRINVIGGSGFAGGCIVREAAARGHTVRSWSRSVPTEQTPGVEYLAGDVLDPEIERQATADADVVVMALSPRGPMEGKVEGAVQAVANLAQAAGERLGVVGGAGSLLVAPGGPMLAETADFPPSFKPEADEMARVLADLRASDEALDWFFLSPAPGFSPPDPGERTGVFRLGGDVALWDDKGGSDISGADFAVAFVDEIESPAHHRQRFTLAY